MMENRPTLEDEWTDRIYAAFNKQKRLATAKNTHAEENDVKDLVLMTKEQEERALDGTYTRILRKVLNVD